MMSEVASMIFSTSDFWTVVLSATAPIKSFLFMDPRGVLENDRNWPFWPSSLGFGNKGRREPCQSQFAVFRAKSREKAEGPQFYVLRPPVFNDLREG
jgi:hypothetical protein